MDDDGCHHHNRHKRGCSTTPRLCCDLFSCLLAGFVGDINPNYSKSQSCFVASHLFCFIRSLLRSLYALHTLHTPDT